jgi:hypothetical protein
LTGSARDRIGCQAVRRVLRTDSAVRLAHGNAEAAPVGPVDWIPEPVRILVDAPFHPDRIRTQERPELRIEVPGMEVNASVFGVRARESRLARVVRQDDRTTIS